ncbi:hypothetical protein vseg_010556 [Gypsophila vaccaria]
MVHQWRQLLRYTSLTHHFSTLPQKPTSKIPSFHQFHPSFSTSTTNPSLFAPNSSLSWPHSMNILVGLFSDRDSESIKRGRDEFACKVSILKDELVKCQGGDDPENVGRVLSGLGTPLLACDVYKSVFIELMKQLYNSPLLALQVFSWRRKHADPTCPISSEEYAKGIRVAGRAKDVGYAVELFTEAVNNRCKTPSTYNALMSAYMANGMAEKCQELFREFKKERDCSPNIITYNILISVFGRLMLVDHMEATLQEIHDSCLIPNAYTFNSLIAGYVTAWMWDRMENTYLIMKETLFGPDIDTYKLMVRGYAHSGNLEKMEEMYELFKKHSNEEHYLLMKTMIAAYCKSSCANKIEKIDELLERTPDSEHKPWLTATLIRFYAQEELLDRMEYIIDSAFKNNVIITSTDVMRWIITAYYKHDAVDKLSSFVKRAEDAGWRICRSLYHCKMVMYSSQGRLEEMENVHEEMNKFGIDNRRKKSLVILCTAYSTWGQKCKLEQVVALMLKLGYDIHWDKIPL